MQKDLWRIEDVTAGLSANKSNYKVIIDSIKNPGKRNTMQLLKTVFTYQNIFQCTYLSLNAAWQTHSFPQYFCLLFKPMILLLTT